jgi:hypothetical protein
MVIITDNNNNKFEIILKINDFNEFFGLVYIYLIKLDPFIDFDDIIISFSKNNIIYTLKHNFESKQNYDLLVNEYNIEIIKKKSFKYYYNNNPKKILINEINNINNFIIKLCTKENINEGNFIIILEDSITKTIYYKCYLNVIQNEYWDKNDKEFVYNKTFNIYNYNNYLYNYDNDYNIIFYKLKVVSI